MDVRNPLILNPAKCRELRTVSAIDEQSALVEQILSVKTIEQLSVGELKDIALIYNEKSDYDNARKFFSLVLDRLEQGSERLTTEAKAILIATCHYGLANIERESGNDSDAIWCFLQAKVECDKMPKDSPDYIKLKYDIERNLGIAYIKSESFESAAKCFKAALEVAKGDLIPAVMSYYGLSLVLNGDQEGFKHLDDARLLYPENAREMSMDWASHRHHMGRAWQSVGNHPNAILEFTEALRLRLQIIGPKIGSIYFHSRVGDTHAGLGLSNLALGTQEEARKWLVKALENYQALKNTSKSEEIETALKSIALPVEVSLPMSPELPQPKPQAETSWHNLAYAGAAAVSVVGVGLFAYRLSQGNSVPVILDTASKGFRPI